MIRLARGEEIEMGEGGEIGAMRLHGDKARILDRKIKIHDRLLEVAV
jgi:hypothetical protein